MNRLKLLVIFLIAVIFTIFIYQKYDYPQNNILILADELSLGRSPFNQNGKNYITYLKNDFKNINYANIYDDFRYKDLYRMIYYDENIYYRGEYKNIKYVLRNSKYIILSLNNKLTFSSCNKNQRITEEYLVSINTEINKIISLINNIGTPKIIILSPYCPNAPSQINKTINNYEFKSKNITFINLNDELNKKVYYIPNYKIPYPSLEGHILIYNLIKKEIKI